MMSSLPFYVSIFLALGSACILVFIGTLLIIGLIKLRKWMRNKKVK